jgi:DNA-binding transcriptional ArsR family regulator
MTSAPALTREPIDRLLLALSHPIRREILISFAQSEESARMVTKAIREPRHTVGHHITAKRAERRADRAPAAEGPTCARHGRAAKSRCGEFFSTRLAGGGLCPFPGRALGKSRRCRASVPGRGAGAPEFSSQPHPPNPLATPKSALPCYRALGKVELGGASVEFSLLETTSPGAPPEPRPRKAARRPGQGAAALSGARDAYPTRKP